MKLRRTLSVIGSVSSSASAILTVGVTAGCAPAEEPPADQTPKVTVVAPAARRASIALSDEMPLEYTDNKGIHWVGEVFDVNEDAETAKTWAASRLNVDLTKIRSLEELDDATYAETTRPMQVVLRDGHLPVRYIGSPLPLEKIARARKIDRAGGRGYVEWTGGPMHELPPPGLDAHDAFTLSLRRTLDPAEVVQSPSNDPSQFGLALDPVQTAANIINFDGDNRTWDTGYIDYQNASSAVQVLIPDGRICSGTMIGHNTAMTAAHCYWEAGHSLGWPKYRFGRQHWLDLSTNIVHDQDAYGGIEVSCQTLWYPAAFQAGGSALHLEELDYAVVDYYANGCGRSPAYSGSHVVAMNPGYGPSYYYGAMTYAAQYGYDTDSTGSIGGAGYLQSILAGYNVVDRFRTPYTNSVWVDSADSAYPGLARHILDSTGGASGSGIIGNVLTWEGNPGPLYWLGVHVGALNTSVQYNYMRRLDAAFWSWIVSLSTDW